MKKNRWFALCFIIFSIIQFVLNAQTIPQDSLYLGQAVPGSVPKVFNLLRAEGLYVCERIAITKDGKEIYYSQLNTYPPTIQKIFCYKYVNNKWQGPEVVFNGYMGAKLSLNDSIIYMQRNDGNLTRAYYSVRTASGWSSPVRLLSTNESTHYFQVTNNSMYCSFGPVGNHDLCRVVVNNGDTTFQNLGLPINNTEDENDFFVAKDDSYIIYSRSNSTTAGDMFITYNNGRGGWTNPKLIGPPISLQSPIWEYGQFIPDNNKYLFFTRGGNDMSSYYVYWVKIDNIIDSLKHTNFIPYVKNAIANQNTLEGQAFNYTVPDSTFVDDDGAGTLRFSASLSDGNPLPSWLTFNSATRTFSGTPVLSAVYNISVTALDSANASAACSFTLSVTSPPIPADSMYLGQAKPGNSPVIFNLATASGLRACERIAISSNNKEIYFGELNNYPASIFRVKCYKYMNNKWQGPFIVFENYIAPRLSVNDNIMYLQDTAFHVYSATRNDTGWNTPVRMFPATFRTHYYQKTALNGTYASSYYEGSPTDGDICKVFAAGTLRQLQSLGAPVNSSQHENDFYIAPDESYILFSRNSPNAAGDIYLSFKKADGKWTNPKKLKPPISLTGNNWEYGEFVSPDGKFLFFTRGGLSMNSYYTYWVKIDNVIDSLRHTNFDPFVYSPIPAQSAVVGHPFQYTVPDSVFTDDDGNSTLRFSASLSDGGALPAWLSFDSTAKRFYGTPQAEGNYNVKVTVKDNADISTYSTFALSILLTGVKSNESTLPESLRLYQNYPNPFNPSTNIEFDLPRAGFVSLKIFDSLGKEVSALVNNNMSAGKHSVKFDAATVNSGVYFCQMRSGDFVSTRKLLLLK